MMRRVVFVVLAGLLAACSSIDCTLDHIVRCTYAMRKADGTADSLRADTLWIVVSRANGTDTLLLNGKCYSGAPATFDLPVSYSHSEEVLYAIVADTTRQHWIDTIRIEKENIPQFESVDCTPLFFHELKNASVTHHAFDSIAINYPHVTYDTSNQNIFLYLKTRR